MGIATSISKSSNTDLAFNPPLAPSGGATMSENVWLSMILCKETWKQSQSILWLRESSVTPAEKIAVFLTYAGKDRPYFFRNYIQSSLLRQPTCD